MLNLRLKKVRFRTAFTSKSSTFVPVEYKFTYLRGVEATTSLNKKNDMRDSGLCHDKKKFHSLIPSLVTLDFL